MYISCSQMQMQEIWHPDLWLHLHLLYLSTYKIQPIKLYVSFAEYCLFYRALSRKRPIDHTDRSHRNVWLCTRCDQIETRLYTRYSQSHLRRHFRKLKAQSSNVSFATFQWKETFELSFELSKMSPQVGLAVTILIDTANLMYSVHDRYLVRRCLVARGRYKRSRSQISGYNISTYNIFIL